MILIKVTVPVFGGCTEVVFFMVSLSTFIELETALLIAIVGVVGSVVVLGCGAVVVGVALTAVKTGVCCCFGTGVVFGIVGVGFGVEAAFGIGATF